MQIQKINACTKPTSIPFKSHTISHGSQQKHRTFIQLSQNRKILKTAVKEKKWPNLDSIKTNDDGMELAKLFILEQMKKHKTPSSVDLKLFLNLSSKTSSTSLFQVIDLDLMTSLKNFLEGTMYADMFYTLKHAALLSNLLRKYPVIMGLLRQLCQPSGIPSPGVRKLFLGLISHTCVLGKCSQKV